MPRWFKKFFGRKRRKEEEQRRLVQREAERIATEGVTEALSHDKKLRRAFRGLLTRAEAERLQVGAQRARAAEAEREDFMYGTTGDTNADR